MSVWTRLMAEVEDFTTEVPHLPVLPHVTPSEIRTELEGRYSFKKPVPLEVVTADVIRLFRAWTVHVTHPRYFGLFNPSVREASIVADTLVALYNPQLATWSHAPVANEIESLTLDCFAKALGFDPETTLANFTAGGAEANLSAVLAALAQHFPDAEETGVVGLKTRPAIYLTGETHHSFVKIARMTGVGTGARAERLRSALPRSVGCPSAHRWRGCSTPRAELSRSGGVRFRVRPGLSRGRTSRARPAFWTDAL